MNTRVIRVMPNTPATVLCGASAFARGLSARPEDSVIVSRLFSTVGFCTEVAEAELDAVTGVSGSGPAYVSRHSLFGPYVVQLINLPTTLVEFVYPFILFTCLCARDFQGQFVLDQQ